MNCNSCNKFILWYLQDYSKYNFKNVSDEEHEILHKINDYNTLILDCGDKLGFKETDEFISFLQKYDKANEKAISQYKIIKDFLISNDIVDFYLDILSVVSKVHLRQEMNFPAQEVFYYNFGSFLVDICKGKSHSEICSLIKEEQSLLCKLYIMTLSSLSKDNVKVSKFGENILDGFEYTETEEIECGSIYDGYDYISCLVLDLESEVFEKVKNVKYIPFYYTDDVDISYTLIGNIITINKKSHSEECVSYQIIDRIGFDTYEEMFAQINPKEFGFFNADTSNLAQKCKKFYEEYSSDEKVLALYVAKLDTVIK